MNPLQRSLLFNAIFSGISGILLILFAPHIAKAFGVSDTRVFQFTGVALVIFTILIGYQIKWQNPLGVLFIISQDILWVVGSILLLLFQPFSITATGNGILTFVAAVVLWMAFNQAKAMARIDEHSKKGFKQLAFQRTIPATTKVVWPVISDVAHYHEVAPNIDDVTIISGEKEGMVRSCSHGKKQWTETCTLWEKEKAYAFIVNTNAPDYPYPFKYLKGRWEVEALKEERTKILLTFDVQYRRPFQNWLLHPFLKRRFSKIVEALLDNWEKKITSQYA